LLLRFIFQQEKFTLLIVMMMGVMMPHLMAVWGSHGTAMLVVLATTLGSVVVRIGVLGVLASMVIKPDIVIRALFIK
jgi:hypothetical protein